MYDSWPPPKQPKLADFYAQLGVEPTATIQQIKQAHNSLIRKYHPDKQRPGALGFVDEFLKVREAFEFLRDASKRAEYDALYPKLHHEWSVFHAWQEKQRQKRAEMRRAALVEKARQAEIGRFAAREKEVRERKAREESARRQREEKERTARLREVRERLRMLGEKIEEQRRREVAQAARERLGR